MLRLLHYCGPTVTHLSLWQSESRALLRDASQRRGSRFDSDMQPAWAVGEADLLRQVGADDAEEACESASQHEADMPRWLRAELASAPADQVARRHAAHFFVSPDKPTPRQWRRRPHPRACTPTCLSLVMSYPFFENERPELFANLVIWTRVQELDVYVAHSRTADRADTFRQILASRSSCSRHSTTRRHGAYASPRRMQRSRSSPVPCRASAAVAAAACPTSVWRTAPCAHVTCSRCCTHS